jgi:hypothetical protein
MQSDAEFELWLEGVDQRIATIFRRYTWQLGALTAAYWVMIVVAVVIITHS